MTDEGAGEAGVLKNVKLRRDRILKYIYIEADEDGHKLRGITMLGKDPLQLESLYHILIQHIGKPLIEIGDLEVSL
jgi:hypothetical protein